MISILKPIILLILQIVENPVFSLEYKVNELYDYGGDSESTDNESSYRECNYREEYISSTAFVGRFSRRQDYEETYDSPMFCTSLNGGYIQVHAFAGPGN